MAQSTPGVLQGPVGSPRRGGAADRSRLPLAWRLLALAGLLFRISGFGLIRLGWLCLGTAGFGFWLSSRILTGFGLTSAGFRLGLGWISACSGLDFALSLAFTRILIYYSLS